MVEVGVLEGNVILPLTELVDIEILDTVVEGGTELWFPEELKTEVVTLKEELISLVLEGLIDVSCVLFWATVVADMEGSDSIELLTLWPRMTVDMTSSRSSCPSSHVEL